MSVGSPAVTPVSISMDLVEELVAVALETFPVSIVADKLSNIKLP